MIRVSSSSDQNHIDELKKSLYSRTVPDVQTRRKVRFEEGVGAIKSDWEHPKEEENAPVVLNTKYKDNSMSFFTKLFIASAIFCIVVVGIGAYLFLNGSNLISADNISINISGPVSVPGGEPVSFDIVATNNNNIELQLVDMSVDFPSGTINPEDTSQTLKNYRKLLGNIPSGGSVKDSVTAIVFGEENLQKQINVTLTYSLKGSTSIFTKTKSYDVIISSSPINVSVTTLKEVTSGQDFDIKVELASNSKESLKGIIFEAKYPFGFNFVSSTFQPLPNGMSWNIGDIPPGGKRSFTIRGSLTGEDNDIRVFHFNVGAKSQVNPNTIGTQYVSIQREISLEKPFVSLAIEFGGDDNTKDFVSDFDHNSTVTVRWFNNLSTIISNMKIVVDLKGTAYDNSTVSPDGGYFNSGENSITWSQQTNPEFASIGPGDSGTVSFNIVPRNRGTVSNPVTNPSINISASVSGNRTQETNVPVVVTSSVKRNIVIASSLELSGRVVRSIGSLINSGPIPPKIDQVTTYTVVWSINNTSNSVRDAVVKATLPPYVRWSNAFVPNKEDISYDENSGLVTWNIGDIDAHTSSLSTRKEVDFQIALTPSVVHVGNTPVLVNQATLSGVDRFTNSNLSSVEDALTTRFSTDPVYRQGDESVLR